MSTQIDTTGICLSADALERIAGGHHHHDHGGGFLAGAIVGGLLGGLVNQNEPDTMVVQQAQPTVIVPQPVYPQAPVYAAQTIYAGQPQTLAPMPIAVQPPQVVMQSPAIYAPQQYGMATAAPAAVVVNSGW